jgi:CheY-like chemotaxis protein
MNRIKTCCIIDDDPIFIYGTKRMMKETDFCESIVVYNNGKDALIGLQESYEITHKLPQVIFLDLNMPIMNGWEFLDEFIRMPSDSLDTTVIYVISSSVDPRDIEKVKEYELISSYILKPITPNDLKTVLKTTLV